MALIQAGRLPALYTPAETARYLGVSVNTLRNRRSLGKLPRYVRLADGQVRYRFEDLRSYVEPVAEATP